MKKTTNKLNLHENANLSKTGIVFGGEDHEEQEARRVAREAGFTFIGTATAEDRNSGEQKKVHGGNAKFANDFEVDEGSTEGAENLVVFENSEKVAGELTVVLNCDHHKPGDQGYGKPAEEYFEASSLGQLMNYLKIEPNQRQRMIAAGDHCPAEAYNGNCPGVDVEKFTEMRLENKVDFYKSIEKFAYKADKEQLKEIIDNAKEILLNADENEDGIVDLRGQKKIDELPEAALMLGKAYMTSFPDTDRDRNPTGYTKIVIGGHTTTEMIEKFMNRANKLDNKTQDAYGDPARGFAGIVVDNQ